MATEDDVRHEVQGEVGQMSSGNDTDDLASGATVRDNPGASRYELVLDDRVVGICDYRRMGTTDDVLGLPHTEIVPELRGGTLGDVLVTGALDDIRRRGHKIVPLCWFVAEFIQLNPDYSDLVATGPGHN